MHIQEPEEKRWIQEHVEGVDVELTAEEHRHILERLNAAEAFEQFLGKRYVGQKRFGLDGAESAIPLIDAVLECAAADGLDGSVMGMAHRGRLNVLTNIVGKSYDQLFAEFEGSIDPETIQGSGDVKYHLGQSGKYVSRNGEELPIELAANPSHLEAVDPVVLGMTRARQDIIDQPGTYSVLPFLIHGDAAFAGQGVVAETLQSSQISGYRVGGTIHLVINNQLGFTTPPESARSSEYPTDIAKMVASPIIHVNGDDPEACVRAARLAYAYRQRFHKDVVIDMICYRRFGHNEGDDPSYTQPLMYKKIEARRSVRKQYTESLVNRGDLTLEEAEQALDDFQHRLQDALDQTRENVAGRGEVVAKPAPPLMGVLPHTDTSRRPPEARSTCSRRSTRCPRTSRSTPSWPSSSTPVARPSPTARATSTGARPRRWRSARCSRRASACAWPARTPGGGRSRTGTRRWSDNESGVEYQPLGPPGRRPGQVVRLRLAALRVRRPRLRVRLLGREQGHARRLGGPVRRLRQRGDDRHRPVPGVRRGQVGPDLRPGDAAPARATRGRARSTRPGRIERFLTLCAEDNMQVAYPSTAGQYFHLLRRQMLRDIRKPLIVFTPKSLLRAKQARSPVATLANGTFEELLDDPGVEDRDAVKRVVLASAKVAHEAIARRDETGAPVAVVRAEQLYPWPEARLEEIVESYPNVDQIVWLQEEPRNMGAWRFVKGRLFEAFADRLLVRGVARAESASPATGAAGVHKQEQEQLLQDTFAGL